MALGIYAWTPPITFPFCVELTDIDLQKLAEKFPSIIIYKADDTKPASIKICWIEKHKFKIEKTNIKEIWVIIGECIKDIAHHCPGLPSGFTPERIRDEAIRYVKSVCDRIDIEVVSDVPEERFCFILPTEWRFKGILKNNVPVPFEVTDTNKVCFTITHTSPTVITIQLTSDVTQTVQATTSIIAPLITLMIIVFMVKVLLAVVRRKG